MSRFGNALAAGVGGVLNSVADSYGKRNVAIEESRLRQEREAADLVRMRAMAEMQEEFGIKAEDRKRATALKMGSDIDREAGSIRDKRQAAAIDDPELQNLTSEELALMRTDPEARKAFGGVLNATRQSDLEDRATAANKLGHTEAAKEARSEIQTEINNKRVDKQDEKDDKRHDQLVKQQDRVFAETIRHNKAAEAAAFARTGAEKLSPAAKVQLEIASTGLSAAQRAESEAAKNLNAANKGYDDVAKAEAKAEYAAAKKEVTQAMKVYQATGKAHLGADFKDISMPEDAAAEPSAAMVQRLMQNPDKAADFDAKFGAGASAKYLKKDGAQASASPSPSATPESTGDPERDKRLARVAEQDKYRENMKKVTGASKSDANAERRNSALSAEFESKLSVFDGKPSKKQVADANAWFNEQADRLTSAQMQTFRKRRQAAGVF